MGSVLSDRNEASRPSCAINAIKRVNVVFGFQSGCDCRGNLCIWSGHIDGISLAPFGQIGVGIACATPSWRNGQSPVQTVRVSAILQARSPAPHDHLRRNIAPIDDNDLCHATPLQ
jgi:hypothetical protein